MHSLNIKINYEHTHQYAWKAKTASKCGRKRCESCFDGHLVNRLPASSCCQLLRMSEMLDSYWSIHFKMHNLAN